MSALVESYLAALKALSDGDPKPLLPRVKVEVEDRDPAADVSFDALQAHLENADINDGLRKQLHLSIARWDAQATTEKWALASESSTMERRQAIYAALGVPAPLASVLDSHYKIVGGGPTVISDEFVPWYSGERRSKHGFYWPAYVQTLESKGWQPESLHDLDAATSKVIERLTDPERKEARQSKGLVVGYVQSGKTANFTGVVARAVDAGYRLIVVLTGTVEMLRQQTQRRLDFELVGKENILRGIDPGNSELMADVDYHGDPDWASSCIEHGLLPSDSGFPDIIRLTTHERDYEKLRAGIVALDYEKVNNASPLYDPVNLYGSNVRLLVVKKNGPVLRQLVKDLKKISAALGEIPALIIDDESDQASVNTTNPKNWKADSPEGKERTAINRLISELLGLLPRAQYVGYTATPFANVFVDPGDVKDIFPKDYLIALDRPPGYMGASDFHDLDPDMEGVEKTIANSNEKCLVRDVRQADPDRHDELREAIDAFVLAGALKLYRETELPGVIFKHHTMLVHESVKQIEHTALAGLIKSLWASAAYSSPSGLFRLKKLFTSDFFPVCDARPDGPTPSNFEDLEPFIGQAITRITRDGGDPVIIVNGNKDLGNEEVAFDRRSVWRILVGGTKLSRGFTVEGLTVSYYRRKTKQGATLMQMGRWFGFRNHYSDLVRLYIGREEPDGRKKLDLYQALEAIVRDEEAFRSELQRYSRIADGKPLMTPREIPPLVSQHLPWLRPEARNKMFNAKLVKKRVTGAPVIPTGYPKTGRARNFELMLPLLQAASMEHELVVPEMKGVKRGRFSAYLGVVDHRTFVTALTSLTWMPPDYYAPEIAFVGELARAVDDWLVIVPQLDSTANSRRVTDLGERSIFKRDFRSERNLWGEPTDRKHRPSAVRVAGAFSPYDDPVLDPLCHERRGAILLYLMNEDPQDLPAEVGGNQVVVGMGWVVPTSVTVKPSQVLQFEVRDKKKENEAIVDTSPGVNV